MKFKPMPVDGTVFIVRLKQYPCRMTAFWSQEHGEFMHAFKPSDPWKPFTIDDVHYWMELSGPFTPTYPKNNVNERKKLKHTTTNQTVQ